MPVVSPSPAPVVDLITPVPAVLPCGDDVTLLFRKSTERRPRLRVDARRTRPLRSAFEAHCRRFGLQESQVRFSCDGLLSPDHSPGQLGLEDGDVTEAEEVYEGRRGAGGGRGRRHGRDRWGPVIAGFACADTPRAVFTSLPSGLLIGEVCTVDASAASLYLEICPLFLEPLNWLVPSGRCTRRVWPPP